MTQPLPETDKDFLELLLFKVLNMKRAGQSYFTRKMPADKRDYDEAKKSLNDYLLLLKKKGYNPDRFNTPKPESNKLF